MRKSWSALFLLLLGCPIRGYVVCYPGMVTFSQATTNASEWANGAYLVCAPSCELTSGGPNGTRLALAFVDTGSQSSAPLPVTGLAGCYKYETCTGLLLGPSDFDVVAEDGNATSGSFSFDDDSASLSYVDTSTDLEVVVTFALVEGTQDNP